MASRIMGTGKSDDGIANAFQLLEQQQHSKQVEDVSPLFEALLLCFSSGSTSSTSGNTGNGTTNGGASDCSLEVLRNRMAIIVSWLKSHEEWLCTWKEPEIVHSIIQLLRAVVVGRREDVDLVGVNKGLVGTLTKLVESGVRTDP